MPIDVSQYTDEQIAAFRDELTRRMDRLRQYLADQLQKAPRDADGNIKPRDPRTLAIARETLANATADFEAILGTHAPDAFKQIAADVLQTVHDDLVQQGIGEAFTTSSVGQLTATVDGTIADIADRVAERSSSLSEVISDVLSSPVAPDEAIKRLEGELDLSTAQVTTVVDTATMAVDRTVVVRQAAESGYELFLWDGPVDDLTRDWCRQRAGKLLTLDELDEVSNDTGPNPPSQFGGGYNCRHRPVPIDESDWGSFPRWQGRALPSADSRALTDGRG